MPRINLEKSLRSIFIVWITVITFRYASISIQSIRFPISPGADIEWLSGWFIAAVVMGALAVVFRYASLTVGITLASACLLITILSGTFMAAAITLWLFAVAWGWGRSILRFDSWGSSALAIPLGLIVLALPAFVMGAAHILTTSAVWLLLIGLTLPLVRSVRVPANIFAAKKWLQPTEISFPLLMAAPVVLLNFIWAVAPEIQYDAINYHLTVPRMYLSNAGFVNLPYFFHSYFFRLVDMLFTVALALQGPAAAKLMSFGFAIVASCCVFVLGKLAFDARTGAWAAALFYTTPIVSWLSSTASNDLAVAMFLTASLIAFLKYREDRSRYGWLYVAALLAGATIATKVDGAFGLIPLFVLFLWQKPKLRTAIVCALLLLVVALPWYAMTFLWTGNPVFPLLNGLFKSPLWATENRVMNAADFGLEMGFGSLVRIPFRLVLDTVRFGEAAPRGTAGITLLLVFPFSAALIRRYGKATLFLIATSAVYLLLWAYSFQYLRYYTQILPVVCILAAATGIYFRAGVWLAIALVLQLVTLTPQYWNIPERAPVALALGRETREHFLGRTLQPYGAVQYLNKVAKPGDKVLGVETDDARFYLNVRLESLPEATLTAPLMKAKSMPSDKELATMLRQAGFAYILTSRSALMKLESWYPYLQPEFLRRFAQLEFRDSNVSVYRLKS